MFCPGERISSALGNLMTEVLFYRKRIPCNWCDDIPKFRESNQREYFAPLPNPVQIVSFYLYTYSSH